jgi:hypothetical protein
VAVIVAFAPAQTEGLFTVTAGAAFIVTVPDALVLEQPVVVLVITTLYGPAVLVVKLATLPGSVTPAGVVHA